MTQSFDFTFITYRGMPLLDADDRLAAEVLEKRGYSCQVAIWDDPEVDWGRAGVCVLRSTWDYHLKSDEFIQWAELVSERYRLINDIELVRWNHHKQYLLELAAKGLPVIDTVLVPRNEVVDIRDVMNAHNWQEAVIKPAIGLATTGVRRVDLDGNRLQRSQQHLEELTASGDALIQKYVPSVTTYGERSLVFFQKQYSHAIRKAPFQRLAEAGHAGEKPADASDDELRVARAVIECLPQVPSYARVDLAPDEEGKPLLMELELIEPSLFLSFDQEAPQRFADALVATLQTV